MLKNYLLITLRNLRRNKLYAFICILGLALGISCTTFIYLYVSHELSYDQFHPKKERIYRITGSIINDQVTSTGLTSIAVGPTLKKDYAEVEDYVRIMKGPQYNTVFYEGKTFEQSDIFFVDSAFFHVFGFELVKGDPLTVLAKPYSMVISETEARKIFGMEDPIGKTLKTVNNTYTITGITKNIPSNTDIQFNALISLNSLHPAMLQQFSEDWFRIACHTYILFKEKPDVADFKTKLDAVTKNYVDPFSKANGVVGTVEYNLQPITKVHLDNSKQFDSPKGNKQYLYIFSIVGIFIILIACINYVNLSLSQSLRRAKEVGIRKTLGSFKGQLIRQFLGESFLISLLALSIGLVLVELLIPSFNALTGKDFKPSSIFQPEILLFYLILLITVGFLSGAYPAFVLSSFQPVTVLKGIMPKMGSAGFLRKALVVVQFVFSAVLVLGTIVVFSQMQFMKFRDLGFDRDFVFVIQVPQDTTVMNQMGYIKQELARIPEVKNVSLNGGLPGYPTGELLFRVEKNGGGLQETGIKFIPIDETFIDLMGLQLITGRNIDPRSFPTDSLGGFIINETAAKRFGWDQPLGKRMQWGLGPGDTASNDGKVIGVVKDFNFASAHNPIEPLVLFYHGWNGGMLALKIQTNDIKQTITDIEKLWKSVDKIHHFRYTFLDDKITSLYKAEEKMLTVFGYFSMISILIASMGLFALTSYSTERRTREIGIRKVLGASMSQIALLISKEFIMLVGIAFLVAMPLGYYFLNRWLMDFAFRVSLSPFYFVVSAIIVLLIATAAVSYSAFRAGRSNPVKAIKYE